MVPHRPILTRYFKPVLVRFWDRPECKIRTEWLQINIQGYLLIKRVCKHATPCGEWGTVDERSFGSKEANQACYDLGYIDGALDHTGGNGGSGGNNENKKAFLKFGLKSPHGTGFAQWANLNRFYVSCSSLRRRQNQLSDCNLGKVDPKYAMVHGHKNFDLVIQCKSKFTFLTSIFDILLGTVHPLSRHLLWKQHILTVAFQLWSEWNH